MADDPLEILARYQRTLDGLPPLPSEIAASDRETLEALLAGIPRAAHTAAAGRSPLAGLSSIPIVIDDTLPPCRVEFRDGDGKATRTLRRLAGHWFDEDELRAAAERARQISLMDYYRSGPFSGVTAGPLFDGRLQPPGV